MRGLVSLVVAAGVIGLGFWAYQQNILTQQAEREVARLEAAIAAEHERLAILRSEWAYLNRPDRLRDLVDMNFARLGLLPMQPDQFATIHEVRFPDPFAALMDASLVDAQNTAEDAP
ncbi:cell division protein FtsL [Rhodobacteraceae bacterium XHP0102]|nr:cell division protein FtsL [Rhodobacteraceae bacterium XHP0102]